MPHPLKKSCNTLALIRNAGIEPQVIEYVNKEDGEAVVGADGKLVRS